MFWIAVTYFKCHKVIDHDAPAEMKQGFSPGYRRLIGDLGLASFAEIRRRCADIERTLPRVWELAGWKIVPRVPRVYVMHSEAETAAHWKKWKASPCLKKLAQLFLGL